MNLKWLNSFLTVADCGSITAAATELFISPQALLQQINLLEDEVGVKLLNRSRSGITLTIAGQEFLNGAHRILGLYDRTVSRCHVVSKAEKTMRIPMMRSIILPEFMEHVCASYKKTPDAMRIEFITDDNFGSRIDNLVNLKYDMVECFTVDQIVPSGIHFELLCPVQTWCIMSEHHPLSKKEIISLEDLNSYRLLYADSNYRLIRYIQMYIESSGLNITLESIGSDRYHIIDQMNKGAIYTANEDITRIFPGFASMPLDFDTHVYHGLACRKELKETYQPFFDIAHNIIENEKA